MTRNQTVETIAAKTPPYYKEEVWNKLASLYNPLVKLILLPFGGEKRFRKTLIDFANPRKGEQVLAVCSDTGTLTSLIAERVGSSGTVIGVDLSVRMINSPGKGKRFGSYLPEGRHRKFTLLRGYVR